MNNTNRRNNKNFKIILVLIFIVVIIVLSLVIYNNNINSEEGKVVGEIEYGNNPGGLDKNNLENAKIENGKKINVSKKLAKEREYNGLKITNIILESDVGVSKFEATVTNNTTDTYKQENVNLKFFDENGNEIGKLFAIISEIKPNSTTIISTTIASDIINAEDFKIESIK